MKKNINTNNYNASNNIKLHQENFIRTLSNESNFLTNPLSPLHNYDVTV